MAKSASDDNAHADFFLSPLVTDFVHPMIQCTFRSCAVFVRDAPSDKSQTNLNGSKKNTHN